MGKHKWRRRLLLLVLLVVVGVVVLSPEKPEESLAADRGEETIVGWMIDRIAAGEVELSDENSIRQMLDEAEQELEISLSEEDRDRIVAFLKTLGTIEVEAEDFIEQAKEKYRQYSEGFVEEANKAINEAVISAVQDAAHNFFDSIREFVDEFFLSMFSK